MTIDPAAPLSAFLAKRASFRRDLANADEIERTLGNWPEEYRASLANAAAVLRMGVEFETNPPPHVWFSPKPLTMEDQLRNQLRSIQKFL